MNLNVSICRLANGGDYLFQCTDDEEMNMWISAINSRVSLDEFHSLKYSLYSFKDFKKKSHDLLQCK